MENNTNNNLSAEQNFTKYLTWLKNRNLSANTIQLYLSIIRQFPLINNDTIQTYFQRKIKSGEPATLFWKKYALNSYAKFKKIKIMLSWK